MGLELVIAGILSNGVAYLATGWVIAVRDLPAAWRRAERVAFSLGGREKYVKRQSIRMILAWPVVIPIRLVRTLFHGVVEAARPKSDERPYLSRQQSMYGYALDGLPSWLTGGYWR
jgi:hypothetical protein